MVEIEISVLSEQCLYRRIPDLTTLKREIDAREKELNEKHATVNWRFTLKDAHLKLKRLYAYNYCGEPLAQDRQLNLQHQA